VVRLGRAVNSVREDPNRRLHPNPSALDLDEYALCQRPAELRRSRLVLQDNCTKRTAGYTRYCTPVINTIARQTPDQACYVGQHR
jgi:hypothetical protein